jgi:preprotein translocase subunit SecD
MTQNKYLLASVALIIFFILVALFVVRGEGAGNRFPFRFGLDLVGGTELVYRADTANLDDISGAMESLKEVIERRVNIFGVSEPLVQTERAGLASGNPEDRLIVGLPGVTDIEVAIRMIGETPVLEFMLLSGEADEIFAENPEAPLESVLMPTGLTGRYLSRAQVEFEPNTQRPLITLEFNKEGGQLFSEITREHRGEVLAIVLDGAILSAPVIQEEIRDGRAQISGAFTPEDARNLARNLNYGALPVPIELASSQTVGATLGEVALNDGVRAGVIGFMILIAFMILWYRVPGVVASVALLGYIIISLAIFKLIPVTLTAAGVAGFILSLGLAVDANILIFERAKEEMRRGKSIHDALREGFYRAWPSIRDANISSIITAVILFWLGTAAVKGFALTLGIGIMVSMLTAISVSRTFLLALAPQKPTGEESATKRFLFSSGIKRI